MNVLLRVTGFGLLLLLIILVPLYKIFGLSWEFWLALAVCLIFIIWSYFAYRKIYTLFPCPGCGYNMSYLQIRKTGKCQKCGYDMQDPEQK
jgi:hypothetical protein